MTALNDTGPASMAVRPQTLHAICELTRAAACGHCWADAPGQPCVFSATGPDGLHIARFAAAVRRGLITAADFGTVIETAGVFTNATIIYDDTLAGRR
jgi:hypothetical protein